MGFVNLRIENNGKIAARRRLYKTRRCLCPRILGGPPSGRLITGKGVVHLNIKPKMDHVPILYDIVLAFQAHLSSLFSTLLAPQPDIVFI